MHIEDTVTTNSLPVDSLAMLARLEELLKDANTNSLRSLTGESFIRARAVLWLLNLQIHSQLSIINMEKELEICLNYLQIYRKGKRDG